MKVTVIAAGFERRRQANRREPARPTTRPAYTSFDDGDDALDIPTFVQG
jgi:hypothetical protein